MAKSRAENILTAMINQTPYAEYPQSRLEDLLLQLKEVYEQGGGGSTPTAADVSYDNTTSGMTADDVQDAIDEVFQSVSSGKTLVAGAITDKGVTTSASDTFATMATNIAAIPTGGGSQIVAYGLYSQAAYLEQSRDFTIEATGTLDISVVSSLGSYAIKLNGTSVPYTLGFNDSAYRNNAYAWHGISVAKNDVLTVTTGTVSYAASIYESIIVTPTS